MVAVPYLITLLILFRSVVSFFEIWKLHVVKKMWICCTHNNIITVLYPRTSSFINLPQLFMSFSWLLYAELLFNIYLALACMSSCKRLRPFWSLHRLGSSGSLEHKHILFRCFISCYLKDHCGMWNISLILCFH